jgi:uncharacterized protein YjbJ (UPF0337 family)
MQWDEIKGNWTQLKGKARSTWGRLTDDDLERVAGQREQLAGALQEKYGWAKDEVERQVEQFIESLDTSDE